MMCVEWQLVVSLLASHRALASSHEHEARVSAILGAPIAALAPSALRGRLVCLRLAAESLDLRSALGSARADAILAEAILQVKASSSKVRAAALEIILSLAGAFAEISEGSPAVLGVAHPMGDVAVGSPSLALFLTKLAGSMAAAPSTSSRAGAVIALARVAFEFSESALIQTVLPRLTEVVLLLLREGVAELSRAVLQFCRVVVSALPPRESKALIPSIVPALLSWSGSSRKRVHLTLRNLLDRLVRRFGEESVRPHVPAVDEKLFLYVCRMRRRADRVRALRSAETEVLTSNKAERSTVFDALIAEDEEGELETIGPGAASILDGSVAAPRRRDAQTAASGAKSRASAAGRSGAAPAAQTWLRSDDAEPADLLERGAVARLIATDRRALRSKRGRDDEESRQAALERYAAAAGIRFRADGKLEITGDASSDEGSPRGDDGDDDDDDDSGDEAVGRPGLRPVHGPAAASSRAMADDDDDDDDDAGGRKSRPDKVKASVRRTTDRRGRSSREPMRSTSRPKARGSGTDGSAYRSKKGAGDALRKGQTLEPYAYVPLHMKSVSGGGGNSDLGRFDAVTASTMGRRHRGSSTRERAKRPKKS